MMLSTIERAIKQEFGCYYIADELPAQWSEDFIQVELPKKASSSSQTLKYMIGDEKVPELVGILRAMQNDPVHPLIQVICDSTLVDWTEEPEDWRILQSLLGLIAENLEQQMVLSESK
jgi:hypothetical protein